MCSLPRAGQRGVRAGGNNVVLVAGCQSITAPARLRLAMGVAPWSQSRVLPIPHRGSVRGVDQALHPLPPPRPEVEALLTALDGVSWIMAVLLYGSGLRLMECLQLRVNGITFTRNEILVREGKGNKDRMTMLPAAVEEPLLVLLDRVRRLHERGLKAGCGRVRLPDALARKYPNADREWGWQWVFPASRIYTDPRYGSPRRENDHDLYSRAEPRRARRPEPSRPTARGASGVLARSGELRSAPGGEKPS